MESEANNEQQMMELIQKYMNQTGFSGRKLTDTPTDSLQMVNRKYVTQNGSVAGRPNSSVATIGQFYLDTNSNTPMWKVTAGWANGIGSIVAGN